MKKLIVVFFGVLLSACGGGGSSGGGDAKTPEPPAIQTNTRISGQVLSPQVIGASVQAFAVANDGTQTPVGKTVTASDGSFELEVNLPEASVFLVQATGGTYTSESTTVSQPLDAIIRAVDVRASAAHKLHISPYTEVGVRFLRQQAAPDWSTPAVAAANAKIAAWLGVSSVLNFQVLDLRKPFTGVPSVNTDVAMSLYLGVFNSFSKRLDGATAPSMARSLDGLERLMLIDEEDDRLFPAFLGGMADFVDLMAIGPSEKLSTKSLLFGGAMQPLGEWEIKKITPKGVSSGSVTAKMQNDVLKLVDEPLGKTRFNKRGALIGFTSGTDATQWTTSFTNSVAEVFGDGEIGIGRWNGGAIASATLVGDELQPGMYQLNREALQYAVAAPALASPGCGARVLNLLASTEASLPSLAFGAERAFVGLTADSTLGLQYLGSTYVGADIGLRMADQTVARFRTRGGSGMPWLSDQAVGKAEYIVLEPVSPTATSANQYLQMRLAVGGEGARKAAAKLRLEVGGQLTEIAAAFGDPNVQPQTKGCGNSGTVGPGLSSRPVDGPANVFMHVDGSQFHMGAWKDARFGASGELAAVLSPYVFSGPVYELAGTAQASIGRVNVTENYPDNKNRTWSVPYAVSIPGAKVPNTGTFRYTLIAQTGVMLGRGSGDAQIPPGIVSSAQLEIVFGQNPVGTFSPWYGTALFRAEGSVAGQSFLLGEGSDRRQALSGLFYGEGFNAGSGVTGAISGPDGEYAVVSYSANIATLPLYGTLLFKRQ
ncbi:hypothetical protein LNV08_00705 [Paucibacter sp. TC2R-5]|uniref:hypothetical protein n=1 Tax=Paucibacter sp. TC2R-5 TaxID=2893555 RepID=UPI0021E4DF40|nr:hypothetical protein [Paucibacter sp. TC2R-5]MCV2357488.1 hypothetical protein [Paucibacter sp. TC2R-5]